MNYNPENKRHAYFQNEIGTPVVNDPIAPYGVVTAVGNATECRMVKGHTLEEAKVFINTRFRELYQVDYDAI